MEGVFVAPCTIFECRGFHDRGTGSAVVSRYLLILNPDHGYVVLLCTGCVVTFICIAVVFYSRVTLENSFSIKKSGTSSCCDFLREILRGLDLLDGLLSTTEESLLVPSSRGFGLLLRDLMILMTSLSGRGCGCEEDLMLRGLDCTLVFGFIITTGLLLLLCDCEVVLGIGISSVSLSSCTLLW
jgi:hypothetical protein